MVTRPPLAVVPDDVHALEGSAPAAPASRGSRAGIDDPRRDIPKCSDVAERPAVAERREVVERREIAEGREVAERRAALERRRSMRNHPASGARSRALATVANFTATPRARAGPLAAGRLQDSL